MRFKVLLQVFQLNEDFAARKGAVFLISMLCSFMPVSATYPDIHRVAVN